MLNRSSDLAVTIARGIPTINSIKAEANTSGLIQGLGLSKITAVTMAQPIMATQCSLSTRTKRSIPVVMMRLVEETPFIQQKMYAMPVANPTRVLRHEIFSTRRQSTK